MSGFFGVISQKDCVMDLFFGVDYHSHLGTRRGGMVVYDDKIGFQRAIHNIENSPFRTKFEKDAYEMEGTMGIGCISDNEPQPLVVRSHLGHYAVTTVGRINNESEVLDKVFANSNLHFQEMSSGKINATELVASLINQKDSILDGIRFAQEQIDGAMSILLMTPEGIYAARDKNGRTPVVLGKKDDARCVCFESSSYLNLGYKLDRELGAGEIIYMTLDKVETVRKADKQMKVCAFLWTYYGYPTSNYENINVEEMRYRCGKILAQNDDFSGIDVIAGIPDSGVPHAIGYSNFSGVPFARPFIKYTPTWQRSFMPTKQSLRNLAAHMKLIPVDSLIRDKSLLFIDDSIVRGTQMGETVDFLYDSGAKQVHIRSASPPILYGCKYLNFSRTTSEMELITRRAIMELEGEGALDHLDEYADSKTERYKKMVEKICEKLNFTTLAYQTIDGLLESIGLPADQVCTYCWNGKE